MKVAQLAKTVALAEARTGRRIRPTAAETKAALKPRETTKLEKRREELRSIQHCIQETRDLRDKAATDARVCVMRRLRGKPVGKKELHGLKATQTRANDDLTGLQACREEIEKEIVALEAEEQDRALEAEAATLRADKRAVLGDMDTLDEALNTAERMIHAVKDTMNSVRTRGGHVSAEAVGIGFKDLLRTWVMRTGRRGDAAPPRSC